MRAQAALLDKFDYSFPHWFTQSLSNRKSSAMNAFGSMLGYNGEQFLASFQKLSPEKQEYGILEKPIAEKLRRSILDNKALFTHVYKNIPEKSQISFIKLFTQQDLEECITDKFILMDFFLASHPSSCVFFKQVFQEAFLKFFSDRYQLVIFLDEIKKQGSAENQLFFLKRFLGAKVLKKIAAVPLHTQDYSDMNYRLKSLDYEVKILAEIIPSGTDSTHTRWNGMSDAQKDVWNYCNNVLAKTVIANSLAKPAFSLKNVYQELATLRDRCEAIKKSLSSNSFPDSIYFISEEEIKQLFHSVIINFPDHFGEFMLGGVAEHNVLDKNGPFGAVVF